MFPFPTFPVPRRSTTISSQRRSIRSRRSWRRRGGQGCRNRASWASQAYQPTHYSNKGHRVCTHTHTIVAGTIERLKLCGTWGHREPMLFSLCLSDGPLADPALVRPTGPNQMVSRMQNPAGTHTEFAHKHTLVQEPMH